MKPFRPQSKCNFTEVWAPNGGQRQARSWDNSWGKHPHVILDDMLKHAKAINPLIAWLCAQKFVSKGVPMTAHKWNRVLVAGPCMPNETRVFGFEEPAYTPQWEIDVKLFWTDKQIRAEHCARHHTSLSLGSISQSSAWAAVRCVVCLHCWILWWNRSFGGDTIAVCYSHQTIISLQQACGQRHGKMHWLLGWISASWLTPYIYLQVMSVMSPICFSACFCPFPKTSLSNPAALCSSPMRCYTLVITGGWKTSASLWLLLIVYQVCHPILISKYLYT